MIRTCKSGIPAFISHSLPVPQCCPVSKNPRPGSMLRVSYLHNGIVVPVEALVDWVAEYVDGHAERGIRNMEEMIQDIAQRCAEETKVRVRAVADLLVLPPFGGELQQMRVSARARPVSA